MARVFVRGHSPTLSEFRRNRVSWVHRLASSVPTRIPEPLIVYRYVLKEVADADRSVAVKGDFPRTVVLIAVGIFFNWRTNS